MPVCNKQHIIPAITTSERSLTSRRADFLKLSSGIFSLQPNISRRCSCALAVCSCVSALSEVEKKGSKKLLLHPAASISKRRASPVTATLRVGLDSQSWGFFFLEGGVGLLITI